MRTPLLISWRGSNGFMLGKRIPVGLGLSKSFRCECCGLGLGELEIQRHHTRGRSDDSDYLDLCTSCHLWCGHGGCFKNKARKPRICRLFDRMSFWRTPTTLPRVKPPKFTLSLENVGVVPEKKKRLNRLSRFCSHWRQLHPNALFYVGERVSFR